LLNILFGLRSGVAVSNIRSAELLDNFHQHVGSSGQCQLALPTTASNRKKGWVSNPPGEANALDDFCHSAASMALGVGISCRRKLDSLDPGNRPGRIAG
jgi:hypothetical protein